MVSDCNQLKFFWGKKFFESDALRIQRPPLSLGIRLTSPSPSNAMQITSASITPTKKWLIINGPSSINESTGELKAQQKMYEPTDPSYPALVESLTRMGLLK